MRAFTLNRDQIKGIAMMTMLLNHISQIFMTSGTFWAELFWMLAGLRRSRCVIFLSKAMRIRTTSVVTRYGWRFSL
mgnify:CR=1 FL=1